MGLEMNHMSKLNVYFIHSFFLFSPYEDYVEWITSTRAHSGFLLHGLLHGLEKWWNRRTSVTGPVVRRIPWLRWLFTVMSRRGAELDRRLGFGQLLGLAVGGFVRGVRLLPSLPFGGWQQSTGCPRVQVQMFPPRPRVYVANVWRSGPSYRNHALSCESEIAV